LNTALSSSPEERAFLLRLKGGGRRRQIVIMQVKEVSEFDQRSEL
jgi:hypothetical protein